MVNIDHNSGHARFMPGPAAVLASWGSRRPEARPRRRAFRGIRV